MTSQFAFALGFFAATFLVSVISHWAALLGAVLGKHGGCWGEVGSGFSSAFTLLSRTLDCSRQWPGAGPRPGEPGLNYRAEFAAGQGGFFGCSSL